MYVQNESRHVTVFPINIETSPIILITVLPHMYNCEQQQKCDHRELNGYLHLTKLQRIKIRTRVNITLYVRNFHIHL